MKATNLMIGDWVYRPVYEELEPVRVVNIHETGALSVYDGSGDIFFDYESAPHEISPIPLTPEILEKNGFERRKETRVDCYDLRQDKASMYLEIKDRIEHEWLCVIGRHYPTSWRCRLELRVHEVHELQHALRLCGIEKEIIL